MALTSATTLFFFFKIAQFTVNVIRYIFDRRHTIYTIIIKPNLYNIPPNNILTVISYTVECFIIILSNDDAMDCGVLDPQTKPLN